MQRNLTSSWSFTSVRANARVWGRRETLLRFRSADSSELLSAWSVAPVAWEQSPAPGWGHHVRKKVDDGTSATGWGSLASKAAVVGKGGSGRGCFRLVLELFVELEENVQVLEVCQKALYAFVKFMQLQVT